MILEALYRQGEKLPHLPANYAEQQVRAVLTINEQGVIQGLDVLEEPRKTLVPTRVPGRGNSIVPILAYDNLVYLMGVGSPTHSGVNPEEWAEADARRHQSMQDMVSLLPGGTIKSAIEGFLHDNTRHIIYLPMECALTEEQLQEIRNLDESGPICAKKDLKKAVSKDALIKDESVLRRWQYLIKQTLAQHPGASPIPLNALQVAVEIASNTPVLLQIEGHPDWWLQPDIMAWWQERMSKESIGNGEVFGECSLTHKWSRLARLCPDAGGKSLISFNSSAVDSYGFTQAYNSQLGEQTVELIADGLSSLLHDSVSIPNKAGKDQLRFLLWDENRTLPELARTLIVWDSGEEKSDPDLWDTLSHLALEDEGTLFHGLVLTPNMKRWAITNTFWVSISELVQNLQCWTEAAMFESTKDGVTLSRRWNLFYLAQALHPSAPATMVSSMLLRVVCGKRPDALLLSATRRWLLSPENNHSTMKRAIVWLNGNWWGDECTPPDIERRFPMGKEEQIRIAYYMGAWFKRIENVQWVKSRPNDSLSKTHMRAMLEKPRETYTQLATQYLGNSFREYMLGSPQSVADGSYTQFQQLDEAGIAFGGKNKTYGQLTVPRQWTNDQKYWFLYGFETTREFYRMDYAEKQAQKGAQVDLGEDSDIEAEAQVEEAPEETRKVVLERLRQYLAARMPTE